MDVTRHRYAVDDWGVGEIVVRDGVLVAHAFPSKQRRLSRNGRPPRGGRSTAEVTLARDLSREEHAFVSDLCRRFARHLCGERVSYGDVPVDDAGFTTFQRELLAAARAVAWGDVVTYGELAALAGRPRAARAAGSFCARGALALVVPYHRIVAAGRDEPYVVGGYGPSGVRLKRRLLALEGTLL